MPKEDHSHGTLVSEGLWYSKDSGFELTAFSDADHIGCLVMRSSLDFYTKFYNSLGKNRCSSSIGKTQGLLSFTQGIVSTSNSTAIGDMDNLVKDQTCVNWKSNAIQANDLTRNTKIVAVEYQKALLASLDVSALDKPHLQLKYLSRRFIYESNPDDADETQWEVRAYNRLLKRHHFVAALPSRVTKPKQDGSGEDGSGDRPRHHLLFMEEGHDEEEEEDELYKDANINQGRGIQATLEVKDSNVTLTLVNLDGQQQSSSVSSQFVTSMLNLTLDVGMESIFETTSEMDAQTSTSVAPLPMTAPTMTPSTIATITTTQQAPLPLATAPSTLLQDLPNFGSLFGLDHRLKTLEANFFEFMQTNQFARASDRLRDETQAENDEFLKTIDENMQKIIKERVKEQVKVQVSKILPKIEQTVNEQLEAEVLTRSSNSSKTSYAIVADLFEMELKKILIKKMKGNKSIQRSNEQRNLHKALVKAYESDKIILDIYKDTVTLKRRRNDDADRDEEPSDGSDRGSKRRREGKEPESASSPIEKDTRSASKSPQGSRSR
nr:hypothetical protein [Tanacetum cinerariifolium]